MVLRASSVSNWLVLEISIFFKENENLFITVSDDE